MARAARKSPQRRLSGLVTERHREILLLVGVLACTFSLVSLAGWSPGDPTPLNPGTGRVENYCGPVGAALADVLLALVGYGAWAMVVPLALGVLALARRDVFHPFKWLLCAALYVMVLAVLELALRPGGAFPPGGLAGRGVVLMLETAVGTFGAWFVVVAEIVLVVTVLFRIDWRTVATRVVERAEVWLPVVWGWARAVGARIGGCLGQVAMLALMTAWWVVRSVAGLFGSSAAGLGGVVARMAGALGRTVAATEPRGSWVRSELSELLEEPDALPPSVPSDDEDDRTVVAGGRVALAEIEWDPTTHGPQTAHRAEVLDMFPDFSARRGSTDPGTRPSFAIHVAEQAVEPIPVRAAPAPPARGVAGVRASNLARTAAEAVADPARVVEVERTPEAAPLRAVANGSTGRTASPPRGVAAPVPLRSAPVSRTAVPVDEEAEDEERLVPDRLLLHPGLGEHPGSEDEELDEDEDAPVGPPPQKPGRATPPPRPKPVAATGVPVKASRFLDEHYDDDGAAIARSPARSYELPPLSVLDEVPPQEACFDEAQLRALAHIMEEKLLSFKIGGKVTGVRPGPVVTIFEFLPEAGIRVSRIAALEDDLAMALKATRVRVVAPIPGRGVVGIEIPSATRLTIFLRDVLASPHFREPEMALPCILGKDVSGRPTVADLAKMPHLLIGGTTGSGKSVGVNGMLMSMLFTKTPAELRLLLVDPKMLEFELYEGIPHLLHPVVTEPKKAAAALAWACREMDDRYRLLARWGTRNIVSFNRKVEKELEDWNTEKAWRYAPKDHEGSSPPPPPELLPYIVIVIDELADLMMIASKEVEESIARIAQKARACGIHLVVATQRPSVDVVTGLIKANLPTRIAFQLRTKTDSRTVLDQNGAEQLLGRGDMLYLPPGVDDLKRCHGAFVSDDEVARVTGFWRDQGTPAFLVDFEAAEEGAAVAEEEMDELYEQAVDLVTQQGKASTSMIQRHLKIGYNRAARMIEIMETMGVVGPADGARPREVLMGRP